MIDPCADMQVAITAACRADAGLQALFPGGKVRVYDIPPTNAPKPYLVIGNDHNVPDQADCLDASEFHAVAYAWSLTDPPGMIEAKRLAAALQTVMLSLASPAGWRIVIASPERLDTITDTDGRTARAEVAVEYLIDPA